MMAKVWIVFLSHMAAAAAQQNWSAPLPEIDIDNRGQYECKEKELVYEPVVSYRISGTCGITDVTAVGDYRHGTHEIKSDIPSFRTERTVREFTGGEFVYRKEIRIELHRALEKTSTLVCKTDMMEEKVLEARIVRAGEKRRGRRSELGEPVNITNGRLPDLGVFTHSREITAMTNRCDSSSENRGGSARTMNGGD